MDDSIGARFTVTHLQAVRDSNDHWLQRAEVYMQGEDGSVIIVPMENVSDELFLWLYARRKQTNKLLLHDGTGPKNGT